MDMGSTIHLAFLARVVSGVVVCDLSAGKEMNGVVNRVVLNIKYIIQNKIFQDLSRAELNY
jgi:hypothetical protein